ncbi:DNA kinase/phosphatase Pnk1 [Rhodotorula toruloides]
MSTLLHPTYGRPQPSDKIAAFALDRCLVKFNWRTPSWQGPGDWQWNDMDDVPSVKTQLKDLLDDGYAILIFSSLTVPSQNRLKDLKDRVGYILRDLNLPGRLLTSTQYDPLRFSAPGAWLEFEKRWNGSKVIDLSKYFYVGDAAERIGQTLDCDHKFAGNIGVHFYVSKHFFSDTKDTNQYEYHGWLASKYKSDFFVLPTSTPLIPKQLVVGIDEVPPEVILFTDPEDTNALQHLLSAAVKPKSIVVDAFMP